MTITHPFHPLRGQQVEVIRYHRGVNPRIVVRLPGGRYAALPLDWTDCTTPAPHGQQSVLTHLLDLAGLMQASQFVDHMRHQGRFPSTDTETSACTAIDQDYD